MNMETLAASGGKAATRSPAKPANLAGATNPRGGCGALRLGLLIAAVGIATAAAHWPALSAQARTFDDRMYLINNPLVQNPSWASVGRFFREILRPSTVQGYYQPLAMTSLMLDYARGGSSHDLRAFHETSLALHVLNTGLILVLLHLLFRQPVVAAAIALLFGLHPLTVEPIPWVSERKTLLATCFVLCCLILYVQWARRRRRLYFLGAGIAFVLALLSKPTSTPLPILLLLLDYWPLRRMGKRALLEKIPLLAIAGAAAVITVVSQGQTAYLELPHLQSGARIPLTICHNVVFYLSKMVWPGSLTPHYPIPNPFDLSHPALLAGVVGTVVLVALLLVSWRWTRALVTGWLWFFVAIFPTLGVIGFTNVITSDKYAYLPAVGILLILAFTLTRVWGDPALAARLRWRRLLVLACVAIIALLEARATRRQLAYWENTEKLYRYMLTLAPQDVFLHSELGSELSDQGRYEEAVAHFETALRLYPNSYVDHNNLATVLMAMGRFGEAVAHFEAALRIKPDITASTCNNLGWAYWGQGRAEAALAYFERAVQLDPELPEAHASLGFVRAQQGQWERAVEHYEAALRLRPDLADAHLGLGGALAKLGRLDQAEAHFRHALRLQPQSVAAYNNLASLFLLQGKVEDAVQAYQAALRIAPEDTRARAGLEKALSARP